MEGRSGGQLGEAAAEWEVVNVSRLSSSPPSVVDCGLKYLDILEYPGWQ